MGRLVALPTLLINLAVLGALLGCAGQPATVPAAPERDSPLAGIEMPAGDGMASGLIGHHRLVIDPATLEAVIEPGRALAAQGDLALLSIRPFLGPSDVEVESIRRTGPTVTVTVRFSHPFDAPADLNPPATAIKRADLHAFDVNAVLMVDGTDSFFSGPDAVTLNADILANADAYRDPTPLIDPADFGITTATAFPYKVVSSSNNPATPLGNYNPSANGWQGPSLLAPIGYDVFPQGASIAVDFELDLTTSTTFDLVTLAKYLQPKGTDPTKANRLPVAGNPAALQYLLPEGAGDVQTIGVGVTGTLMSASTTEIVQVDPAVVDWDHGATVAASFPNNADLGEISESSDVATVAASFPDLSASAFVGSVTGTSGATVNCQIPITNASAHTVPVGADVLGLVRITDEQDLDDATDPTKPTPLSETNPPLPIPGGQVSSTRYQVARVFMDAGIPPTCLTYAPAAPALTAAAGVPWNLDLDAAATPATHPDGIAGYQIDYDNNGSFEATSTGPGGTGAGDFTVAGTFPNGGNHTVVVRVTANAPTSTFIDCPLVVVVSPVAVLGVGNINTDCPNSISPTQDFDFTNTLLVKPNGDVYAANRQPNAAFPPTGYCIYKSTNAGVSYVRAATINTAAAGGAPFTFGSFSMGFLGTSGLPCIAYHDSGTDLVFVSSTAETPTTINFGQDGAGITARGVEIAGVAVNTGTWAHALVLPHPTNQDRVYVASINSASLGPALDGIALYLTTNATAAAPTFVQVGQADTVVGASEEDQLTGVVDSLGNLHLGWETSSVTPADDIAYRKWLDGTQVWESASEVILNTGVVGTGDVEDPQIRVNAANEPVVAWIDDLGTAAPLPEFVYFSKNNAGTWTPPARASEAAGDVNGNDRDWPALAYDNLGRILIAWEDERVLDNMTNVGGSLWSADGSTRLTADLFAVPALSTTNDFQYPRIVWNPTGNYFIVTSEAQSASGYGIFGDHGFAVVTILP